MSSALYRPEAPVQTSPDETLASPLGALALIDKTALQAWYAEQPSQDSNEAFTNQLDRALQLCLEGNPYQALRETELEPMVMAKALFAIGRDEVALEHWTSILEAHLRRHSAQSGPSLGQLLSHAGGWRAVTAYYSTDAIPTEAEVMDMGGAGIILACRGMFPGANMHAAWAKATERGNANVLAQGLYKAQPGEVPAEAIRVIAASEDGANLLKHLDLIEPGMLTPETLNAYLMRNSRGFMQLYTHSKLKLPWVERCVAAFGVDMSHSFLTMARDMMIGKIEITQDLRELGVNETGEAGIEQLRAARANIMASWLDARPSTPRLGQFIDVITRNPIARNMAQQIVRFDEAQWGKRTDEHWQHIILQHLSTIAGHQPMPPSFVTSPQYNLARIDVAAFDPSKIDQGAVDRFMVLQASINEAASMNRDLQTASRQLQEYVNELLRDELAQLPAILDGQARKLAEATSEKAQIGLARAIEATHVRNGILAEFIGRRFDWIAHADPDDMVNLSNLKRPAIDAIIRKVIFARALRDSPDASQQASRLQYASLDFDALDLMVDFVDHTLGQEVYGQYFSQRMQDDAAKYRWNAFERTINVAGLKAAQAQSRKGQTVGTTRLQIVPSRSLLLELSGKTGDACWANLDQSLAAAHPNLTALTFVRNPGKNNERIVGSALLIQTTDTTTGQPVLVIRGINPIENYLREVRAEEFLATLFGYVRSIAGPQRVAVVIDGGAGEAGTNRSAIYDALIRHVLHQQTEGGPLSLAANATFNNYRLGPNDHHVYALRVIKAQ